MQCEVDFCPEELLKQMCNRPSDVFQAIRKPIYIDCFINVEQSTKDNLLNAEFKGSVQECSFACHHNPNCKGFSYHIREQICVPKTSFSFSNLDEESADVLSGSRDFCQPWIDMFRHDSLDPTASDCPLMYSSDQQVSNIHIH